MKSYIRGREQRYKQTLVINIKRNAEDALNLKNYFKIIDFKQNFLNIKNLL